MMKKLLYSLLALSGMVYQHGHAQIIISEIMYNPAPGTALDAQLYEFIEITNIGESSVNIGGYSFSEGIFYTFPLNTTIEPGQYLVIARDQVTFNQRYPEVPVLGLYSGGLTNSGERVRLSNSSLTVIFEVTYDDAAPWPVLADGQGFSLVPVDEKSTTSPSSFTFWRNSAAIHGSPGAGESNNAIVFPVFVNEVLSSPSEGNLDKIELYNAGTTPVDLNGWYITDNRQAPFKFTFNSAQMNTIIPAGGYLVVDESRLNPFFTGFSFGKTGDGAFIFSAENGQLTGYSHGFTYKAQLEEVSFGRVVTSDGKEHFVRQTEQTFGEQNAAPKVGPVVIEKIMYHPDEFTDEFLVIKNISTERVELATTELVDSNVYRIEGVSFKFPQPSTTFLEAGESLIITSIEEAAFRTKYRIAADVAIFTFPNALSNSGEKISIETPIYRDTLVTGAFDNHYMVIDEADYSPNSPWPSASGNGIYLKRINLSGFGSEPSNWVATNEPVITGLGSIAESQTVPFVYPTLVENTLTIDNNLVKTITLYDALGKPVGTYNSEQNSINMSALKPGLYLVRGITANNTVLVSKIEKR